MYTGNFQKNIISQIFHICIGFIYNVVCTNKSFKNGQEELNKETAFLLDLASHQFCFPPQKIENIHSFYLLKVFIRRKKNVKSGEFNSLSKH